MKEAKDGYRSMERSDAGHVRKRFRSVLGTRHGEHVMQTDTLNSEVGVGSCVHEDVSGDGGNVDLN